MPAGQEQRQEGQGLEEGYKIRQQASPLKQR
jgi:hypothetical protein